MPSYLGRIFTLGASGASIVLRVEYLNERDTVIHERTYARRCNLRRLRKAYVLRKVIPPIGGASHAKEWTTENSRRILRRSRKSYVNGAGRRLRSRRRH